MRYAPTPSTTYNHADSKKIFVGGLGDKITKDDLLSYFEKFGTITDAVVFYDKLTRKARGFGFVTFDSKEVVDKVLNKSFHDLNGIKVETKNAEPRGSMVRGLGVIGALLTAMTECTHRTHHLSLALI
jgi:RNA-binding protein Musashi